MMVAPLAGAWVEMSNSVLKKPEYIVAPLAGAWVEIALVSCKPKFNRVAPLAGAWVEIKDTYQGVHFEMSLPSRERGLKFDFYAASEGAASVAPLAGAWVEIKLYF